MATKHDLSFDLIKQKSTTMKEAESVVQIFDFRTIGLGADFRLGAEVSSESNFKFIKFVFTFGFEIKL